MTQSRLKLANGEKLILASGSPRRKNLLEQAFIPFVTHPADVDESVVHAKSPEQLVRLLAETKANAVAKQVPPGSLILAADTVVALDDVIFGKPKSLDEAASFLKKLSGKTDKVLTGVAILRTPDNKGNGADSISWTCSTEVFFKNLDNDTIRKYHSIVNPMDKAGAYAIQEHGNMIIDHIDGYMSNVVGLPIEQVKDILDGNTDITANRGLLNPLPQLIKRILGSILAIVFLLVTIPIFLLLALLVKLTSPGPVFYISKRLGKDAITIPVFKFRTMYDDADKRLSNILSDSSKLTEQWHTSFKLENDPRITPIGRILRKTSLDELPQLLNVIMGNMSIIGPRPIKTYEIPKYCAKYAILQKVKPGLTGLWQISGRSSLPYDKRVALDVEYITEWSILRELKIIIKTIPEILLQRGAF